jgi:integrase
MRVASFDEEITYLSKASQTPKDIAQIILDTGLRPEEVFRIKIENLDFRANTIFNPFGKTKAARRKVTVTALVKDILKKRAKKAKGPFCFPSNFDSSLPIGSVRKPHDNAVDNAGIAAFSNVRSAAHVRDSCSSGGRGFSHALSDAGSYEDSNDNAILSAC